MRALYVLLFVALVVTSHVCTSRVDEVERYYYVMPNGLVVEVVDIHTDDLVVALPIMNPIAYNTVVAFDDEGNPVLCELNKTHILVYTMAITKPRHVRVYVPLNVTEYLFEGVARIVVHVPKNSVLYMDPKVHFITMEPFEDVDISIDELNRTILVFHRSATYTIFVGLEMQLHILKTTSKTIVKTITSSTRTSRRITTPITTPRLSVAKRAPFPLGVVVGVVIGVASLGALFAFPNTRNRILPYMKSIAIKIGFAKKREEVETRGIVQLDDLDIEILRHIYAGLHEAKELAKTLSRTLGIREKDVLKKINTLSKQGLVSVERIENMKIVKLTDEGVEVYRKVRSKKVKSEEQK